MNKSSKFVHIIPIFLILVVIIFEGSYNSILFFGKYTPFYELSIIFYWSLFLPRSVPIIILILVGLFRDFLLLTPMGISSISFVFLVFLVKKQKNLIKDRSFLAVFILFIVSIITVCVLNIFILTLLFDSQMMLLVKIFSSRIAATLGFYILAHFIFNLIRVTMLSEDDAKI